MLHSTNVPEVSTPLNTHPAFILDQEFDDPSNNSQHVPIAVEIDSSTRIEHHSKNTLSVSVATVLEDSSEPGEYEQQQKKWKGMRRPLGRLQGSGPKQWAPLETSPPNKCPVGCLQKVVTRGLHASKQAISGLVSIRSEEHTSELQSP